MQAQFVLALGEVCENYNIPNLSVDLAAGKGDNEPLSRGPALPDMIASLRMRFDTFQGKPLTP